MFRPLLKTIANINGNVKLACYVNDYISGTSNNEFHAYVRTANLLPISSFLQQRLFAISLLESSYEYDLKKFYDIYSNYFYDSCFRYITNDFQKLDTFNQNYNRNKEFEYGCTRLSYQKSGYQFCYFAPIYIEGINDIPDYFLLNIKLQNNLFTTEKNVKINIGFDTERNGNYLYRYLSKYAKKIDDNFIYCLTSSKQATYFGVDLLSGTLSRKIDNEINIIYKEQLPINRFDNMLSSGWKRNKMCMKQVVPLAFYFNINDILSDNEKENFKGAEAIITGAYYKNEEKISFYDFDTNYTDLYKASIQLNVNNGLMEETYSGNNILNAVNPGLGESTFVGYRYTNKIVPQYNRWKLKYSTDTNPYIINMAYGFSNNQNSSYKYGSYPEVYAPISGISNLRNNFLAPLGDLLKLKSSPYYNKTLLNETYKSIMNKYCTTWFHSIQDVEKMYEIFLTSPYSVNEDTEYYYKDKKLHFIKYTYKKLINEINRALDEGYKGIWVYYKKNIFDNYLWSDVKNDKTYFGGILYDFTKINDKLEEEKHIDKFAVFVKMNFNILEKNSLGDLKNAKYTILTNNNNIVSKNCVLSDNFKEYVCTNEFYNKIDSVYYNENGDDISSEETAIDNIFIKSSGNTDPQYIDLAEYGMYIDDIEYLSVNDIKYTFKSIPSTYYINIERIISELSLLRQIDGYELIDVYNINNLLNDNIDNKFVLSNKMYLNTLLSNLYTSPGASDSKVLFTDKMFNNNNNNKTFDNLLYIKTNFITKHDLYENAFSIFVKKYGIILANEIKDELFAELDQYVKKLYKFVFKPVYNINGKIIARNIFLRKNNFTRNNYGNIMPTKHFNDDKDLIYVDQFNINSIVSFSNNDISYYNTHLPVGLDEYTYKTYYSYYVNEDKITKYQSLNNSYTILNDENSYTMFARFLNQEHLHYYLNMLYKNFDNEHSQYPQDTLYIRKRCGIYNKESRDFNLKDEYIPLLNLYPEFVNISLTDIFMRIFNDFDYDNGVWHFSDLCIANHRNQYYNSTLGDVQLTNSLFEFLGIDDRYILKNIDIDLVFKKRFIKLNKELYTIANVESISDDYKDLYLYNIEKPYDYPVTQNIYVHKNEFVDNTTKSKTTYTAYDINNCLIPLFDNVKLQDKTVSVFYKEYAQSKISEVTAYHLGPNQTTPTYIYDNYYRYKLDDVNTMYDITNVVNNNSYIVCNNPYTNDVTYHYTYAYVSSYFSQTGWNLLDLSYTENSRNRHINGYNELSKCESCLDKAAVKTATLSNEIAYSYVDKSNPQTGYNTTYSYYSISRFNMLYPEERRSKITYSQISPTTYCVYNTTAYIYYPTVSVYKQNVAYDYAYFNDENLYNDFKLNTYTIPYSYTYYTLETITHSSYVEDYETGESYYVSYNTKESVPHEYNGYYTYGFYLINANFNNTKNSFKLVDVDLEPKKYFSYMNGIDLYKTNGHELDLTYTFDIFMPFSKLNLFKSLSEINTVVAPTIYTLQNQYMQTAKNENGLHDIVVTDKNSNSFSLERYFDAISPCFNKSATLYNSYLLKFKNVKEQQNVTLNNDIIYCKDINIYNYEPIRIYNNSSDSYYDYDEIEHTWFANNKLFNLAETIEVKYDKYIREYEIETCKNQENTLYNFEIALKNNNKCSFTKDEILFLYNRYTVKYEYVPTDYIDGNKEKLYTLTYKFILI